MAWTNGYTNFNSPARRKGRLRVTVENDKDHNVHVQALFSTNSTFSDPTAEIIAGEWTDSHPNRILTGGSVGFAHQSAVSPYNSPVVFTWDDLTVYLPPPKGTVVWIK